MTCTVRPCLHPRCCPRAWKPDDTSPAALNAFFAEVRVCMKTTGKSFGKACAAVFYDRSGCVLS